MNEERFDRQIRLFGEDGQRKLAACHVAVAGVGGLGTHVVQQLALLGVGRLTLIDGEGLSESNRNRYVGALHSDPLGTPKVDIAGRLATGIAAETSVFKIRDSLVSDAAFAAITGADYVFGCLDSEGARLVLNELCSAYARIYVDLATGVIPGEPPAYGGRVFVSYNADGCISCYDLIDVAEAQVDLAGPNERRNREALYGVPARALDRSGPSVVSINGVVASLAVTEFMAIATGLRSPKRLLNYYGNMGRVSAPGEDERRNRDCYYCKKIRGLGDTADVQRYVREGVGEFLR